MNTRIHIAIVAYLLTGILCHLAEAPVPENIQDYVAVLAARAASGE